MKTTTARAGHSVYWAAVVRSGWFNWLRRYWFHLGLGGVLVVGLYQRDLQVQVQWAGQAAGVSAPLHPIAPPTLPAQQDPLNVSMFVERPPQAEKKPKKTPTGAANHFSNVSFPDEDGFYEPEERRKAKRQKQLAYVQRFAALAQAEQQRYGIPASITLGQGLLESDAGESPLAVQARNHFGIKCFSRSCRKGHCRNFTDDSHKDFFRVYTSEWESFRAHSQLLQKPRYRALYRLPAGDYQSWAQGLSRAGYATDRKYAQKLIHLIEDLDLNQYDRP